MSSEILVEEENPVPDLKLFRSKVENIGNQRDRVLIQSIYLSALRVSETITKVIPWELKHNATKPYGKYLTFKIEEFQGEKALVLKYAVAKRAKKVTRAGKVIRRLVFKIIALPCNPEFEPWTYELLKHLQKHGSLSFNLTRQRVNQIVKRQLHSLDDSIHTHSLRHYRISHLVEIYDFDPYDITAFSGWTFKTTFGRMGASSGQLDIYLHMAWKRYFPKLLKKVN